MLPDGVALPPVGEAIHRRASPSVPGPGRGGSHPHIRYHSLTNPGAPFFEGPIRSYSFSGPPDGLPPRGPIDRLFRTLLPAGSVRSSVFNLCSATLGAGSLSLPLAFSEAGYALSFFLLFLASGLTVFSIWLLIDVYERTDIRTYEESTESLAGPTMRRLVEVLTILFCYGSAVAYLIAIGDALAPLETVLPWFTRRVAIVSFCALFMLPTSCLREVNSLRFTSSLGVMVMLYLTLTIGSDGVRHLATTTNAWEHVRPIRLSSSTLLSMPVVLFAYSCQVNVFAIYDELEIQRPRQMLKVASLAMVLCLTVYCTVGFMGYARFGAATKGDILTNYDFAHSPVMVRGMFFAMAVTITAAFPLNVFPLRTSLNLMCLGVPQLERTWAHIAETLCIVVSMLLAALFVPGVDIVFALLGSLDCSLLCFVLPAYLGYCAGSHKGSPLVLAGMVLLALSGIAIAILGTYCTVTERILTH